MTNSTKTTVKTSTTPTRSIWAEVKQSLLSAGNSTVRALGDTVVLTAELTEFSTKATAITLETGIVGVRAVNVSMPDSYQDLEDSIFNLIDSLGEDKEDSAK